MFVQASLKSRGIEKLFRLMSLKRLQAISTRQTRKPKTKSPVERLFRRLPSDVKKTGFRIMGMD
jgi:hypothetical protein